MRLQNDVLSIPARRLMALLAPLTSAEPKAKSALDLLRGWDAVETSQSPQAALFEVWWSRHLNGAYLRTVLDPDAAAAVGRADATGMLGALERPAARFGRNAKTRRDQVLLASLGAAYAELEAAAGPDPQAWRWGNLHYNYFAHPMSIIGDGSLRGKLNVGPFPAQGGADTVNVSAYRPTDFLNLHGASFRVVVDVGNWDNSRAINTPGQSGDPDSAHYRDLAAPWGKGDYFPLLYSRKLIEAATETTIRLVPAR
jgi:penicillin amidase